MESSKMKLLCRLATALMNQNTSTWSELLPYDQMLENVEKADIVITHGGPSSFIMPLQIGKIPIVVGGTGFYIQALLYDIDFSKEQGDRTYRKALERQAQEKGSAWLHSMLYKLDEKAAEEIHPNNTKRIIRALEYYHLTGQKISEHNAHERAKCSPYLSAYFVLNDERRQLYERIDRRVDKMMEEGLLDEVRKLKAMGMHEKIGLYAGIRV